METTTEICRHPSRGRIMEEEIDTIKTSAELAEPEVNEPDGQQEPPKEEPPKEEPENGEGENGEGNKKDDFGKEGHTPKGVQQRINELSRGRREDRETISRLQSELDAIKKAQPQPKEKDRNDFANDEEWVNYVAEKRSEEMFNKRIADWEFNKEMEFARPMMKQREEEARTKLNDFDEVMSRQVDLPVDRNTYLYVAQSRYSALINYSLRKVEGLRNSFINAPIEKRIDVIKGIEANLERIDEEIKKKASQPQEPAPAKAPNEVILQPGLRGPADVKHKTTTRLDPATCSMQEWMDQD